MKREPGQNALRYIISYTILIIVTLISVFPFYFMFVSATNTNAQVLNVNPRLLIGDNLVNNFNNLSKRIDILRVTSNSLIMSVSFTLLSILLHSMTGYALTKFKFKGQGLIFSIILITMMVPAQVMYVPLFKMMNNISWANTYQAIVLPALANGFGIFLMRQNMIAFPSTLLEASRIDGCGEFSIFFRVVMPNMTPAIGALGIYMFMSMWNNFMWPLIILNTKDMYNFPVALSMLDGVVWRKDYGVLMLAASIATLPIMVIFFIFQKQFVAGIMGGAIKE